MADVRGVVLRVDVVVGEDSFGFEVVDETLVSEMVEDAHRFGIVDCGREPAGAGTSEFTPLGLFSY